MNRTIQDPQTIAKIAMLQKGVKARDVAEATGQSLSYTYNLLTGQATCRKGRKRIETFLGVPIWPQ